MRLKLTIEECLVPGERLRKVWYDYNKEKDGESIGHFLQNLKKEFAIQCSIDAVMDDFLLLPNQQLSSLVRENDLLHIKRKEDTPQVSSAPPETATPPPNQPTTNSQVETEAATVGQEEAQESEQMEKSRKRRRIKKRTLVTRHKEITIKKLAHLLEQYGENVTDEFIDFSLKSRNCKIVRGYHDK